MLMDSLSNVFPPQALDVKVEKKKDMETARPIEKTGESRHSELELKEESSSKEIKDKQIIKEERGRIEMYDAKGNIVQKRAGPYARSEQQADSLNLVV